MPDHYHDLPPEPESNLFDEMDAIADVLHRSRLHNCDDDQIAFRQLQKARRPDLSKEEFLTCSSFDKSTTSLG